MKKTVVALGGEGIGPEVVDATCELLVGTGIPLEIVTPPHGAAALATHGSPVPDETKQACESADGVLFGAAGAAPSSAVVTWLRWAKGTYASAVARVYREGKTLTADQGGKATTKEFARAVLEAYRTQ